MTRRADTLARLPLVIGYGRDEAAASIGVCAGTFLAMVAAGKMPQPRRIGARVVWSVDELAAAFHALPRDGGAELDDGWDDVA